MRQTKELVTDLLGAQLKETGVGIDNRRFSFYGMADRVYVRAVWIDKEGSIRFLAVDDKGRSAEVYPCQFLICSGLP